MAKANLGTKRVCPETDKKFYDLDKDPVVSPYTGKEYPLSFFEGEANIVAPKPDVAESPEEENKEKEAAEVTVEEDDDDDAPEIISLEDAEEEDDDADDDIPDIPDIPDVDEDDDDDDAEDNTFLESDDDDDDLSDVIVGVEKNEEES